MLDKDFKEFAGLLNSTGVEYLVVGGYALAVHGRPRYTGDIDFWIRPTPENAQRLLAALKDFGFGSLGLSQTDFTKPDSVVQLGYPPARIDLLTTVDGVDFDAAYRRCIAFAVDGITLNVLHVEDLITNKQIVARPQDLADLQSLADKKD